MYTFLPTRLYTDLFSSIIEAEWRWPIARFEIRRRLIIARLAPTSVLFNVCLASARQPPYCAALFFFVSEILQTLAHVVTNHNTHRLDSFEAYTYLIFTKNISYSPCSELARLHRLYRLCVHIERTASCETMLSRQKLIEWLNTGSLFTLKAYFSV